MNKSSLIIFASATILVSILLIGCEKKEPAAEPKKLDETPATFAEFKEWGKIDTGRYYFYNWSDSTQTKSYAYYGDSTLTEHDLMFKENRLASKINVTKQNEKYVLYSYVLDNRNLPFSSCLNKGIIVEKIGGKLKFTPKQSLTDTAIIKFGMR